MSERESKSKNSIHTTIGGVNQRVPDLPPHEFKEIYGTFPEVAGLQQRLPGKRLHKKFGAPIMGIYQYWTPYGYGGGITQTVDDLKHGPWTIPGINWNIPDIPPSLNNTWIDVDCPTNTYNSTYIFNGDSQGLFYFAGQNWDHGNAWQNPHTLGEIILSSSRPTIGSIAQLVDRSTSNLYMAAGSKNWYQVDLGEKHIQITTAFSVRAKTGGTSDPFIQYIFQGSNDTSLWTDLAIGAVVTAGSWSTVALNIQAGFRYFRLLQTGGDTTFPIGELEIYGLMVCYPPPAPGGGSSGVADGPSGDPASTPGGTGGPNPPPIIVVKSVGELTVQKRNASSQTHAVPLEGDYGGVLCANPGMPPTPVPLGAAISPPACVNIVAPSDGLYAKVEYFSGQSVQTWGLGACSFHIRQLQDAYAYNEEIDLDMAQIDLTHLVAFECIVTYYGSGISPIHSSVDITASLTTTVTASDLLGGVGLQTGPNYTSGYNKIDEVVIEGFRLTYQP